MLQEHALAQEIQVGSPDGYFPCERVGSGDETSMSVTHRILSTRRTQQHTSYLHSRLMVLTSVISKHPMEGLQSTRGTRLTRAEMSMPDTCSNESCVMEDWLNKYRLIQVPPSKQILPDALLQADD